MVNLDFWIKEIIEQVCVGIALKESKLDSGNRVGLIVIDNSVEFGLKFYAGYNSLMSDKELGLSDAFFKILGKIEGTKITADLAKEIRHFHKIRNDLYHRGKPTTVGDKVIDEYVKKAKELFKAIYNFQMNETEWRRLVQDKRKSITKADVSLRESVSFEAVEVEDKHLVRVTTPANLKNTESIMLVIYGYLVTRARAPENEELEQSLMLSGRGISENVLGARLSELRGSGYLERKVLKLKGKATKRLRKKFLI